MTQSILNTIPHDSAIRRCLGIAIFTIVLLWPLYNPVPAHAQSDSSASITNQPNLDLYTSRVITASQLITINVEATTSLLLPLPPRFTHLTVDDGLTNNDVTALVQDHQGFLWIGTRDGLNRYDGYTVVTYRHEPDNPNSLPRNEVRALFVDRDGMLWIATNDGGVTRYDPRLETFETLRHDPANPQSLGGNLIFSIHQTADGSLWFGGPSVSGLTRYDPIEKIFTRYYGPGPNANGAGPETNSEDLTFPRGSIMRMYSDAQGVLWLLTETALARYDEPNDRFQIYEVLREERAATFFRTMLTDGTGPFLIGGGGGVAWFDRVKGHFTKIANAPERIEWLHRDTQGTIWVGAARGLYQFDPTTQLATLIADYDATEGTSLSDDTVSTLLSDALGRLWIGTQQGGLNRLDLQQQQFLRYRMALAQPQNALPIHSLVHGGDGEFWAADAENLYRLRTLDTTLPAQLERIQANVALSEVASDAFDVTLFPLPPPQTMGEGSARVGVRLLADHRGHLWLGSTGTTVFEFDPHEATFTQYELLNERLGPGPPAAIVAMYEDGDDTLWVAVAFTGLYRIDATRTEITAIRYRGRPDFFRDNSVNIASAALTAVTGDTQGTLWLSYHDGTISRFTPEDGSFTHYPSLSVMTRAARPPAENASSCPECPPPPADRPPSLPGQGPPLGQPKQRPPAGQAPALAQTVTGAAVSPAESTAINPSGWIEVLYWDAAASLLWIGERNGLVRFDPATDEFTHYGAEAGLSNTFVVSIVQDRQGDLWLGTQNGLIHFDPTQERADTYTMADGLQDNKFGRLAAIRHDNGQLFFGGGTGITRVDPRNLTTSVTAVPVLLTNMRLYNVPVTVQQESPLQEALWATNALTLQPEHQVVSFEFAALNFAAPHQNRYRYRLEGLENSWNEVEDDRRFATYTSLHPGRYTFRVQAGDRNDNWYPTETTLAIQVLPKWWQTLWFRLLVVIGLVGAAAGGYRYRTHAIALRNRLLEQQVAERTAALQESEERFRGLATSAFEAILIHQDGMVVDANEAATNLFGYPHDTLVGLPIAALLQPLLPATVANSKQLDGPERFEMEGVQGDGTIIPLEVRMRTVPYQGAEALVVALRDLTERRATELQRQQLAALEERERIGRDLHDDLGQIIGYISMQAQTAQELLKQERAAQVEGTLQTLTEAAQSAQSSVRHYILGIRNNSPQSTTLDFFTALDLYVEQVRERHGLTVQVSLPDDLPDTMLTTQVETQLLRIVQEAIANVYKHAGVANAKIVFLLQDDILQVMISDEGRGFVPTSHDTAGKVKTVAFPEQEPAGREGGAAMASTSSAAASSILPAVSSHMSAKPVHSGRDRQESMGAMDDGLLVPSLHFGLDIMRERAEGVGGKLEIRSAPGKGTQVLVNMPRRLALYPEVELRGLRVLLADDHPLYREGLRNMLAVRGIQVVGIAEDGKMAEEMAHQLLPDLILMDIEMPNSDGVAATKAIKAALPEIKIVMLTVAAGTELLLTALKNGASGYLLKNVATEQFFALLAEVLQGETVLSPQLTTSMVATLTTASVGADSSANTVEKEPTTNGTTEPLTAQPSIRDEALIATQLQQLTRRQREVLNLVIQGLTNKEIARELHITERTVKYHIGLILEQMDAQSRYELVHLVQSIAEFNRDGPNEN